MEINTLKLVNLKILVQNKKKTNFRPKMPYFGIFGL